MSLAFPADFMRLVTVAKALGMTGQQLRKELTLVDFGVKPTDREVPDSLAQGVLRYLARKYDISVNIEEIMASSGDAPEPSLAGHSPSATDDDEGDGGEEPVEGVSQGAQPAAEHKEVNVLRKLSLDDVSKEAIARQAKTMVRSEATDVSPLRRPRGRPVQRRRGEQKTVGTQEQIKKKEGTILLPAQITVKEFAEKAGVQVPKVVSALMKNGVLATINQTIDFDTASIVAADLDVDVAREQEVAVVEHLLHGDLPELLKDETGNLQHRAPIVVVMGHVDHGKTSLLDSIRKADVAGGESGGITQHIGAYQVHHDGKGITFLDTPGHEAFTAMRARGARLTDVAVLVVAADDGVKETTIEAINHAKAADVPILVAISKIDRPGADLERVKGELAAQGLQPEEWGGSTPVVPYSSVTKQGIQEVLDHILLLAELKELKANPDRRAVATVIESHLDPALGALATVVLNTGTLHVGEAFVCGIVAGKVRTMTDATGTRVADAPPSCPVRISGFDAVPQVGDILQVVSSDREARNLASALQEHHGAQQKRSFTDLVTRLSEGKLTQLKIVLKADAQGSLEAIQSSLEQQGAEGVSVKVIHAAVGAVTENDVMMAAASDGLVMAFRVDVPVVVQRTAEREGVRIREYDVIYKLFEEISGLLEGLLEPEEREVVLGHLEVKGVFLTKKNEQIIGGRVTDGVIKRVQFRLRRGEEQVGQGRILSLRKVESDIKEAKEGSECGMRVESTVPVLEGDVLEAFMSELKKKKG